MRNFLSLRPSLWRELTYKEFGTIKLKGRVLDLGDSQSNYMVSNYPLGYEVKVTK